MSGDYDNTNRGALFKNEDKESERHPDYKGSLNVKGQEFWIDAWVKTSKAGKKYMSLSIKPKMAREHEGASRNPPPQSSRGGASPDDPF